MNLLLMGINHKKAPLEIREKISFTQKEIPFFLKELRKFSRAEEIVILSTCNRTEFYSVSRQPQYTCEKIKEFFTQKSKINLDAYLYQYQNKEAVEQLLKVAAGIDSMIIGEGGVFYQVKKSFELAQQENTSGPILNTLFKSAIAVGKKARSETDISRYTSSLSAAAVSLSKKIFNELDKDQVLLIGAGKTSELTAKYLKNAKVKCIFVANRTFDRACELAKNFGGQAIKFDELHAYLNKVDIIISSTDAPHYILKYETIAKAIEERKLKPLFIIDLAVPRDIDPAVERLEGVFLYNLDDLGKIVDLNLKQRRDEIPKVEKIIKEETQSFLQWLAERKTVPVICFIKEKMETLKTKEIEKLKKRNYLSHDQLYQIDLFSERMIKKALHPHLIKIKSLGHKNNDKMIGALKEDLGINGDQRFN